MPNKPSRRTFLRTAAAAGAALPLLAPRMVHAESNTKPLRIGGIGVGGKGRGDVYEMAKFGAKIVAVCDIDAQRLEQSGKTYPGAKRFTDWQKLLEMDELDAVTVSTPDHTHAPATMTAIRRGLHVYCQKPLTHSVWEARQIGLATAEHNAVTQMGTQGHSSSSKRLVVELLRRQVVGPIQQIHIWTNRPIWPQGLKRPPAKPVLQGIDWNQWIGVAPYRECHDHLHPFSWRGWLDFGTGALGDIGCHAIAAVWDGLKLTAPTHVWSTGLPPNAETFPQKGTVHYAFPATDVTPTPFELVWYDGGNLPDRSLFPFLPDDWKVPNSGSLIVGAEGTMYGHRLYPEQKFGKFEYPKTEGDNHYTQWAKACLDRSLETVTPFATFSSPLTEAVLLGNVALHYPGEKLQWDPKAFKFPNQPDADNHLKRAYRGGWQIEGLG